MSRALKKFETAMRCDFYQRSKFSWIEAQIQLHLRLYLSFHLTLPQGSQCRRLNESRNGHGEHAFLFRLSAQRKIWAQREIWAS
jgi:hypothetical protein